MRLAWILTLGSLLVLGMADLVVRPQLASAQLDRFPPRNTEKPDEEGPRLPNGKLQRDVILKHEYEQNLEDLRRIHELSGEVLEDMEEQTEHVFSLKTLKKLEELEELSKDVRKRFKK